MHRRTGGDATFPPVSTSKEDYVAEAICEICSKVTKSPSGLAAHIRLKHEGAPDEVRPATTEAKTTVELERFGLGNDGSSQTYGIRVIKMSPPRCKVCTDGLHRNDWYASCPHDPYFHEQEVPEVKEIREDQGDGTYIVTDRKEVIRVRQMPNLVQVPRSNRHATQFEKKRRKGWRLPEEIGVAPFCQFLGCWSQDIQFRSTFYGDYCSQTHALIPMADAMKKVLEVPNSSEGRNKRRSQLGELNFR